jgi:hypothetical protein
MRRGRTSLWIRMRPFLAQFSEPVWSGHLPSWADFITTTPVFRFSVHTGVIFDNYALAKFVGNRLRHQLGGNVGRPSRGKRNDNLDRSFRIGFGLNRRYRRCRQQHRECSKQPGRVRTVVHHRGVTKVNPKPVPMIVVPRGISFDRCLTESPSNCQSRVISREAVRLNQIAADSIDVVEPGHDIPGTVGRPLRSRI